MENSTPNSEREQNEAARVFYANLEHNGQLVNVGEGENTADLPARVTHVRYPDGTVKRIRFTSSGYR